MLERSPKTGAEIMDSIEGMTQGWWRPSPGSVYPLLDELSAEGLIKKREDGRYEITSKGREEVEFPFSLFGGRRPASVEEMLNEMRGYVSYFEDLSRTDKSKIETFREAIRELAERLSSLSK
jgi:DNA-binding PadR family transcriptional regulator